MDYIVIEIHAGNRILDIGINIRVVVDFDDVSLAIFFLEVHSLLPENPVHPPC